LFPSPEAGESRPGIPCLGSVPFDPELAAACDAGTPMPERAAGPVLTATRSLADSILRHLENPS